MMDSVFNQFPVFLLILVRVASFFVTAPLFSYRNIPNTFKLGLALFFSWIMFYSVDASLDINQFYFLLIIKEALVGLFIGFIAAIMTYALQVAGGFIDYQIGFAIANVIDPQTGVQSPLIGRYFYIVAIIFMFAVNAHHLLLDGIFYSYQFIPLQDVFFPFDKEAIPMFVLKTVSTMFLIAFQMAIPIVGSIFLLDVALGIIARTVPQVNVFVVGLPLKILAGFVVILFIMPILFMTIQYIVEQMAVVMRDFMLLIGAS